MEFLVMMVVDKAGVEVETMVQGVMERMLKIQIHGGIMEVLVVEVLAHQVMVAQQALEVLELLVVVLVVQVVVVVQHQQMQVVIAVQMVEMVLFQVAVLVILLQWRVQQESMEVQQQLLTHSLCTILLVGREAKEDMDEQVVVVVVLALHADKMGHLLLVKEMVEMVVVEEVKVVVEAKVEQVVMAGEVLLHYMSMVRQVLIHKVHLYQILQEVVVMVE
jgi:hypothetical protein